MIYTEQNVYEAALDRIRMIFDNYDEVIVSMSGGKDSTVVFELALQVAKEKGRLPLKVQWLDQEAEWQHTVDYMDWVMHLPEVKPYWYQCPFDFPNNLSTKNKTLKAWDDEARDKWIHPLSDIGIHECPIDLTGVGRDDAFYKLIESLPTAITDKECAVLIGMRITESPARRLAIVQGNAKWHGQTWCSYPIKNMRKFWPIYDFTNDDVWTAIAKNHWKYNKVYDFMYQWGVPKNRMRVSALIHETAWHSIEMLQEFEPKTYNRFCARVPGTSTFNHTFDEGTILAAKLPIAFKSWKEYRDYLLQHIIPPEDRETYVKRWKNQEGDEWYQTHVNELILNDTCGTLNRNERIQMDRKKKIGKWDAKKETQFKQYMESKKE